MPRELGTPPSGIVPWEVFAVRGHATARVEAGSWFEARALGEQLLGLAGVEVDARLLPSPTSETGAMAMDLGGCCDPPDPNLAPKRSPEPTACGTRRAKRVRSR